MNESKLDAFMMKALNDISAAASAPMVLLGDRLGLYKAMAKMGEVSPEELAKATETSERYVREWLSNQAAGGYVEYHPTNGKFLLPPEQAMALAEENSPAFLAGGFQIMAAIYRDLEKIFDRFKNGAGMDWGEHDAGLFEGTERFFRPNYIGHLLTSWIPSLHGVEAKLKAGGRVADVGCGLGTSTILMAKAFPQSRFFGFDYHVPSIAKAKIRATEEGLSDRVHFEVAKATSYPGKNYDLVTHFDCLHDMGDLVGAARHVRETLNSDGTWMLVEPMAGDRLEDNLNPVGRLFYAASTNVCVPASLAQSGPALGAQAGEKRLRQVLEQGGFTRIRRATETPFNMVLEARP